MNELSNDHAASERPDKYGKTVSALSNDECPEGGGMFLNFADQWIWGTKMARAHQVYPSEVLAAHLSRIEGSSTGPSWDHLLWSQAKCNHLAERKHAWTRR